MNYPDTLPQFSTSSPYTTAPDCTMNETSMEPRRRLSRGSSCQKDSRQRRSVRIEKPRSIHNSPKPSDRRRTTISSKRYTTLDDHFNMMFGYTNGNSTEELQEKSNARPVSWHPGSTRNLGQSQSNHLEQHAPARPREDSGDSFTSCSIHDSSLPFQHGSRDYSSYANSIVAPAVESYANSPSWQDQPSNQNESYRLSTHSAFNGQPTPWSVPDWVQMTQTRSTSDSSPISPNLAIQAPLDSEYISESEQEGERPLVGMGLYDPPEGYDSWFASASGAPTGKGLKLEETFEPPDEKDGDSGSEQDEDDDDEEMEEAKDDASSDELSVEDPPPAPPTALHSMGVSKQPTHLPVNMSGQSFFFEEDESLQSEWWYQRLRSSAQPAAHGIGYGWL